MSFFARKSPEQHARDYCISWGLDPDEMVIGNDDKRYGRGLFRMPRWRWYVGVSPEALKRPI